MAEDPEIGAMSAVSKAMAQLDNDAKFRVLDWASKKFGGPKVEQMKEQVRDLTPDEKAETPDDSSEFDEFVDLLDKCSPKTNAERALVGGYWFQACRNEPSFTGQQVNDALKDTGHGLPNVTVAFTKLQTKKPALARQVTKAGKSQQSRKTYKLTDMGLRAVKQMILPENDSDGD